MNSNRRTAALKKYGKMAKEGSTIQDIRTDMVDMDYDAAEIEELMKDIAPEVEKVAGKNKTKTPAAKTPATKAETKAETKAATKNLTMLGDGKKEAIVMPPSKPAKAVSVTGTVYTQTYDEWEVKWDNTTNAWRKADVKPRRAGIKITETEAEQWNSGFTKADTNPYLYFKSGE